MAPSLRSALGRLARRGWSGGARAVTTDARRPASLLPAALLVAALNALIGLPLLAAGFAFDPAHEAWGVLRTLLPFIGAIVAVRVVGAFLARLRGRRLGARAALTSVASAAACLVILGFLVAAFAWGKVLVPFFNARTWDAELQALDRLLHFGMDTNSFALALLEGWPAADAFIDWTYAQYGLFLIVSVLWFATLPDLDRRHRFLRGLVLLWSAGLALHWLVPALGPCYVFSDLLEVLGRRFPINHRLQLVLYKNHLEVARVLAGESVRVSMNLGVAAMPSLHVALPAYLAALCSEWRHWLRLPLLLVTVVLVVGSVATGWHYAIDSYVGLALALACWLAVRTPPRSPRSDGSETIRAKVTP